MEEIREYNVKLLYIKTLILCVPVRGKSIAEKYVMSIHKLFRNEAAPALLLIFFALLAMLLKNSSLADAYNQILLLVHCGYRLYRDGIVKSLSCHSYCPVSFMRHPGVVVLP